MRLFKRIDAWLQIRKRNQRIESLRHIMVHYLIPGEPRWDAAIGEIEKERIAIEAIRKEFK